MDVAPQPVGSVPRREVQVISVGHVSEVGGDFCSDRAL